MLLSVAVIAVPMLSLYTCCCLSLCDCSDTVPVIMWPCGYSDVTGTVSQIQCLWHRADYLYRKYAKTGTLIRPRKMPQTEIWWQSQVPPHGYQDVQETVQKPSNLTKLMPMNYFLLRMIQSLFQTPYTNNYRAQVVWHHYSTAPWKSTNQKYLWGQLHPLSTHHHINCPNI